MAANEEKKTLKYQVGLSMRRYFKNLDGNKAKDIFEMVMKEVEKPLLEEVMIHCNWNQSEASKMLGINRGTLRTKLKVHKLI
ncbi:MAG: Fis family transcriptional regulator [Proteobacteria bacterium]|nr:Fis family transcriptional regulator [Pseudomonadota bacterium]MAK15066.1 Fis family transcriptional regulator [Pseudomonadota bacterium]RZO98834.1 MAG: Fis family transcriptional regulator [Gammaproteobacteria bacterium]|tara:strand:+ start:349 stop:594 length:246 start_codon:yes stop_codon:yes gene_type:complete